MVTTNAGNQPTGASNTVLQGQGVGTASAFSTATYPATCTKGDVMTASAANAYANLAVGADLKTLTADSTSTNGVTYHTNVSPFGLPMTGVKFPSAFNAGVASGNNDLYTVPAGKSAIIVGMNIYNSGANATVFYPTLKVSATTYRLFANSGSIASGTGVQNVTWYAMVFQAADVVGVNASASGASIYLRIMEFDNTSGYKSPRLLSLANGNNTLYTVPASKTAMMIVPNAAMFASNPSLYFMNDSGGTRTITWNIVPSGGAVGITNQPQAGSVGIGTAAVSTFSIAVSMNTGDFINITTNASTATQVVWTTVLEV